MSASTHESLWREANGRTLLPHHRAELHASGLTDDTIAVAGIYSETNGDCLAALLGWKKLPKRAAPAIVFPHRRADGAFDGYWTIKPAVPVKLGGHESKYIAPKGKPSRPYFPPGTVASLTDPAIPLIVTEGQKKALAADQAGFPCIGLLGVWNWKTCGAEELLSELRAIAWKGRPVYIAFDSDGADKKQVRDAETRLAAHLAMVEATVRAVRIPGGAEQPDGTRAKVGLDDYLVAHGPGGLRQLLNEAIEPDEVDPVELKLPAGQMDPATAAKEFLETGEQDGIYRLAFWNGGFIRWKAGRYAEVSGKEVRAHVVRHLNQKYVHVTTRDASNLMEQVTALSLLSADVQPPRWLDRPPLLNGEAWPAENVLVAKNGLVHLPSLVHGGDHFHPPTPRFFAQAALDYDFEVNASRPSLWLDFLHQLWPDDQQSIEALQEWFGLSLVPDTSFHKMLLLKGPRRSGKGTIARIQQRLIGTKNCASPTLAQFGAPFGLWGLVGKLLAVVGDARLSGRADQAVIVERLLSISGEDGLDVDRKYLDPLLGYTFPTRLMLLTNELPRLTDSSGALTGRFIVLELTRDFYGHEDRMLTNKLAQELPGILLWSIQGWERLNARGRFAEPDSVLETMQELADLSSPVGAFVRECCVVGPTESIESAELYEAWRRWCEKQGWKEPTTASTFGRDLGAAVARLRRSRPRVGDERPWVYAGIDLKSDLGPGRS